MHMILHASPYSERNKARAELSATQEQLKALRQEAEQVKKLAEREKAKQVRGAPASASACTSRMHKLTCKHTAAGCSAHVPKFLALTYP